MGSGLGADRLPITRLARLVKARADFRELFFLGIGKIQYIEMHVVREDSGKQAADSFVDT